MDTKKLIVLNEKLGENCRDLIFTYNLTIVHNIFSETNSPTNQMCKYMIAMITRAADKILLFTEIFFFAVAGTEGKIIFIITAFNNRMLYACINKFFVVFVSSAKR